MKRENIKIYIVAIAVATIILIGLYKLNLSIDADRGYVELTIIIAIQFLLLVSSIAVTTEILKGMFFWQKIRLAQSGWSDYLLDSLKSIANVLYNIFILICIIVLLIFYGNYYIWTALPLMLLFDAMLLESWIKDSFRIARFVLNLINRISNLPNILFRFIKVDRGGSKLVLLIVGIGYIFQSLTFLLNIEKYTDCVNKSGMGYINECYQNRTDWIQLMRENDG